MGKRAESVSIIGGADGPTSIFIVGKDNKANLRQRIRHACYKAKRRRVEKKIAANPHTLEEVITYIKEKYNAVEVSDQTINYSEQKRCLKESLILNHRPELLEGFAQIERPEEFNEETVQEFIKRMDMRRQKAQEVPDEAFPMDFRMYEISVQDKGKIEIAIEMVWGILGSSFSGDGNTMKTMKRMVQDLYIYYGVTEDDIKSKSERYQALVAALSN